MWRLLDLGSVPGHVMTNMYEAVGRAVSEGRSPNTVILDHPEAPFVNIGYHQLMEKEINVAYAREKGFSLVRRTIGGGAILDGPWEQDYFVVIRRGDPECPATIPEFYAKFLRPPMHALRRLGLDPSIRPPNDILVGGKKISGNGAITIDRANVLAGDLLLESPTSLMSEIIRAPSEKFKDKLAKSMSEWVTSISAETGSADRGEVKSLIIEGFADELGIQLEPGKMTEGERATLRKLIEVRSTEDWIFSKDNDLVMKTAIAARGAKVRGGVAVSEAVHKAGKLLRVVLVSEEDRVASVSISGDFFTQPYTGAVEELERRLVGARLAEEDLTRRVREAFEATGMMVFGATQDDFVKAILKARFEAG